MIPLGVDTAALEPPSGARPAWRARRGIADDDIAALMLGRLSHASKLNPLPMYLALGEAAERVFRAAAAALCPNVALRMLDGRMPDLRVNAFAAADFFTSLVDNIQEIFGLAPVEAARAAFDWRVVIGQYLALWAALACLRSAAAGERAQPAAGREPVPPRPNSFAAFAAYSTRRIGPGTHFTSADGTSAQRLLDLAGVPGAVARGDLLPTVPELRAALEQLRERGTATACELADHAAVAPGRQARLLRGSVWLAKLGLIRHLAG